MDKPSILYNIDNYRFDICIIQKYKDDVGVVL